jgi:hypothetical protein
MKKCLRCGEDKPVREFTRRKSSADGFGSYCKSCRKTMNSGRSEIIESVSRHDHLTQRFGISAAEVNQMIEEQNGLCALCQNKPAVQVDHEHGSGRVRGILCDGCNGGLGAFADRPDLLTRAIDYLRAHE